MINLSSINLAGAGGTGGGQAATPNVDIFGTPVINGSQVSGFTTNDYLQMPRVIDFSGKTWQLDFKFTTGANVTTQQNIVDSGFGLAIAVSQGKMLVAMSSNGTSWDLGAHAGTHAVAPNTSYYVRMTFDGQQYVVSIGMDGKTYETDITVNSTASLFPRVIIIGKSTDNQYVYGGSINLADAVLRIDGEIVWTGMNSGQYATKSELDTLSQKVGDLAKLDESVASDNLVDAINKAAQQGGGTDETVRVVIRTTVEGVSVAGLKLYVYLNDDTQSPQEYTIDENGMCVFKVSADYKYRIVFPDIEGCQSVPDVVHTAVLKERAIEVEYVEAAVEVEIVNVYVKKFENGTNAPWTNHTVRVVLDGTEDDYHTDDNGLVEFEVPIGKTYTVSVDVEEGLYVPTGYSHTFTARRTTHIIHFNYYGEAIGLFIVDKFGDEYSNTEWVAFGKDNADAKYIKIATPELLKDDGKGVFYVKIDDIYNAEYLKLSKQWCTQNVQFNSIPLNGNSPTALYYYDGKSASAAVLEEAKNRSLVVPAFTECNKEEVLENGTTMHGFLWSVGQNRMLYNNREMLDSIIRLVRPDAVNDFSLLCRSTTWTLTQFSATSACYVAAGVSYNNKTNTYYILVCYAPSLD